MDDKADVVSGRTAPVVVIDTTAHPGGGSITYFRNVLPELADDGRRYVVLVPSGRNALTHVEADNVEFRTPRFPVGNVLAREIYRQFVLPVTLSRLGADLLFSPADVTTLLAPCRSVLLVQNLFPYAGRLGFDVSGWTRLRNAVQRLLTKASTRTATEIVYVSEFTRDVVEDAHNVPDTKGVVVHHGVDASRFANPEPPADKQLQKTVDESRYLLTVATVNPHKNVETLLRGFARLPPEFRREFQVLIAGRHPDPDYLRSLRQLAADLDVAERVRFLGKVSRSAIPHLYANAAVYVSPSRLESFGLTVLEAMASETPVVAADATTTPEVCGDAALLFDPDDPAALADALQEVLTDDPLSRSLVAGGLDRVSEFSWSETAEQTKALLDRVLN